MLFLKILKNGIKFNVKFKYIVFELFILLKFIFVDELN